KPMALLPFPIPKAVNNPESLRVSPHPRALRIRTRTYLPYSAAKSPLCRSQRISRLSHPQSARSASVPRESTLDKPASAALALPQIPSSRDKSAAPPLANPLPVSLASPPAAVSLPHRIPTSPQRVKSPLV